MGDILLADSNNSTNTPLAAGQSFVGTFTDVTDYSSISVMITSDQNSSDNGFRVEWSANGVDVTDTQFLTYPGFTAAEGFFSYAPVRARFVRVNYTTNNLIDQAFFYLRLYLRRGPVNSSISPISGPLSNHFDSLSSKSLLFGRSLSNPGGDPVALKTGNEAESLIVERPLNRSVQSERTILAQTFFSQALDLFGLFGSNRRFFTVFNDTIRGNLYIKLGGSASLTNYIVKAPPQHLWELPKSWGMWSGSIDGIWDIADGNARTTEVF